MRRLRKRTFWSIGAVVLLACTTSIAGAAPAAVDLYVTLWAGTSLRDLRGQPNGATVQTPLSFWSGPGLDLINPEAATAAVRFTLPPGISFGGQDLPDANEGCTATQTTATCSWHLEPVAGRNSINWGWDLKAAAPGSYVFTAELVEHSGGDAEPSNNRATLTIIAGDAAAPGGGAGGGGGGGGGAAAAKASAVKLAPARPSAGSTVVASVRVTRGGSPIRPTGVSCSGSIGGTKVRGSAKSSSGVASCLFRTPKGAKGKTLSGSVAFRAGGTAFTKRFAAKLR